ncbi:hypothetical protein QFC21_006588 [Naganishia friedmannii]|uniref:Uncharacterized protein n=1 Tax=Naganishia friedmannii TaxID=89922 RepID=A0ACC2V397_9TREE|nr:hypothetical protein QFC21_006588 [Naganishia friedmannii]
MVIAALEVPAKKVDNTETPEAIRADLMKDLQSSTVNLMEIDASQVFKVLGIYDSYSLTARNLAENAAARRDDADATAYRELMVDIEAQSDQFYKIQDSVMRLRARRDEWLQLNMPDDFECKRRSVLVDAEVAEGGVLGTEWSGGELRGEKASERELSETDLMVLEVSRSAQMRDTLSESFQNLRNTFNRIRQKEADTESSAALTNWTGWKESLSSLDALETRTPLTAATTIMLQCTMNPSLLRSLRKRRKVAKADKRS